MTNGTIEAEKYPAAASTPDNYILFEIKNITPKLA